MSVVNEVLSLLENNRGKPVSGEYMAKKIFVSRNVIWKAVKKLRENGYPIEATTNKGYMLDNSCSILSAEGIQKYLTTACSLVVKRYVTSTNTLLKEMASQGVPDSTVLVAESQSRGKGRMGRSFFSPSGTGIYLSILLRPNITVQDSTVLTVKAAVAVCRAVESVSDVDAKIKWVNDIYVNDRKVCGILTEASSYVESGMIEYAIVGIGVNITPPDDGFPDNIENVAGALFDIMPADIRNRLAARIIDEFYKTLDEDITDEYRRRSWLYGCVVEVTEPSGRYLAEVLGIGDRCSLIVKKLSGEIEELNTGEVSVKKR